MNTYFKKILNDMINNEIFKKHLALFLILIYTCFWYNTCEIYEDTVDYSNKSNWAYFESESKNSKADVFFVCPTVYSGEDGSYYMSLSDDKTKADFLGAVNMEKGIYDENTRFFAPYYRQIGLNAYEFEPNKRKRQLSVAYCDIREAFEFYLENENNGNPIILAGFSQGAEICIELLKDCFDNNKLQKQLIACYAIGWSITESETIANPHIKIAKGEDDIGVIISFNSEAENINESLMIPEETKTYAINPLNWKTDQTPADKSLNIGACFTDYNGKITKEIKNLTGAYIDKSRGALKVTDIDSNEYPAVLDIFEDGIYHIYDYQFFYRNLQENVQVRINSYYNKF